ncbi:hypothetical protein [Marivivens marinus]|uniref:hypothetical protein n=1 Tax=Marivivens marinus TaxID=3110173 RepID=UPI003B84A606
MAELNPITLPPGLISRNLEILGSGSSPVVQSPAQQFNGVIHNGHTSVTATIAPGAPGKIDLTFDLSVPSVSSSAFAALRQSLSVLLPSDIPEDMIAAGAGIGPAPPPPPDSKMAAYASVLFGEVFFGGKAPTGENVGFHASPGPDKQIPVLNAVRRAEVTALTLNGTISVEGSVNGADATVYVPTTAIIFDDGLTIPFSGYSETALVHLQGGLLPAQLPARIWGGSG